jgi:hypothetical protein
MKLSVVIPVQDEEKTIGGVLQEVRKLNPFEVIVVLNGSTDCTGQIAQSYACKVLNYKEALGNDLGRAIGAKHASGDIVLFIDGDIKIEASKLLPFIQAIEKKGFDVALNDLSLLAYIKQCPHYTTVCKLAINHFLRENELSLNSFLAIPHTLSREAIQKIGWRNLADPILAQAIAVKAGLKFCSPLYVDVINTNRLRNVHSRIDPKSNVPVTTSRIIGDHLRAISYLTTHYGVRAGFQTSQEKWGQPNFITSSPGIKYNRNITYSAIIELSQETKQLDLLISEVKKAGIQDIILVGSELTTDFYNRYSRELTIIEFKAGYSPIVARFAGALQASTDISIFLKMDQPLMAKDIIPFLASIKNGSGIALCDRKELLDKFHPTDPVSIGQYFLNMALARQDLFNNSLYSVPYALHKRVFESIGYEALLNPALAQTKAQLSGIKIDVIKQKHLPPLESKDNSINNVVLGDQLEALSYLIKQTDARGGFTDGSRKREWIN